jgi:choline monooxygenase
VNKLDLDRGLARRLLDHIEHHTTDLCDEVMEVPASAFVSDEHYADEVQALFLEQPIVLSLSGSLPEPNSYHTIDICDTPILLTRDKDGTVHSFANICAHRGVRVADGSGCSRRLTCPFHAWVYDMEGQLVGVPVAEGFEGMDRHRRGLVELPVDEKHGLIVGRLRPGDAVDVDDYLGADLAAELDLLDFANWGTYTETHTHRVEANWKTTLDTYRENYHFDYLHRDTLAGYAYGGVLTFNAFGSHVRNASAVKSIDSLRNVPDDEWERPGDHISHQYCFFPNTCVSFDSRHIELWQILPRGPHECDVVHTQYLAPGLSDEEEAKLREMAPWICEAVVDGEDFWVANRTEPGLSTGIVQSVVFGRNEPAPQHLHHGFLQAVAELRARRGATSSFEAATTVGASVSALEQQLSEQVVAGD